MLLFPAMVFVLTLFYNERRSNVRIALKPIVFNLWKVVKTLLFTPQVLKPMLWVYIANASRIAQSQPWSQFLEGELHITPDIQGYIDMISYVFFIIGTMLYGRFLTGVSYRKLFFFSQLGAVAMRFMNIVIIKRWNTVIGIPDVPFLILVSCADNIIDRFNSMPFLVLAAQVCPPNMENTFFALLMSLSNLTVAQLPVVWSKPLLDANGLDGTKWDGLEPVNWIHLGLGFIPLALIWMVPTFSSILTDAQRVEFGLPMREKQVEDVETEEKSKDQTQKS
ncbi:BT1 family-domain-containing protein [Paraphysoderma sedebokerense]|nr:BT1 family-domain-containing protein [Paraphysoderma sedebokerense]KAI9136675.1 BT1 family-domain-containing protein [Paraphysoderma sedebokerense]